MRYGKHRLRKVQRTCFCKTRGGSFQNVILKCAENVCEMKNFSYKGVKNECLWWDEEFDRVITVKKKVITDVAAKETQLSMSKV